jgi:hypothetical protein
VSRGPLTAEDCEALAVRMDAMAAKMRELSEEYERAASVWRERAAERH